VILPFRKKKPSAREADADKNEASKPQPAISRWRRALNRTRAAFGTLLRDLAGAEVEVTDRFYEDLMDTLVLADFGAELAEQTVEKLRREAAEHGYIQAQQVRGLLAEHLIAMLEEPLAQQSPQLVHPAKVSVILVAGVNGTGKTTLLAKLAKRLMAGGISCVAAAADTFRAAAVEQLEIWGKRVGFRVISGRPQADPASVVFDAVKHALANDVHTVLIDTAGRLQTKHNLMEELAKIGRAAVKVAGEERLHQTNLLVLDATTGQNAVSQAKLFSEAVSLTGIVLNKLDGSARGGVIFAVVAACGAPVLFAGVGETADDLLDFDAHEFVSNLLG